MKTILKSRNILRSILFRPIFKLYGVKLGKHVLVNALSKASRGASVVCADGFSTNGIKITGYGNVRIGRYTHTGSNCKIMLGSHDFNHGESIPYGEKYTSKNVEIGDCVWLGSDVTISGNVKIGEGAIVAIGSVVVKDVPAFAIVGGNPAQIIKYRDIHHFLDLKNKGYFI